MMRILQKILIGFVAIEHIFILFMEMFAWTTLGKKTFKGAFPDALFDQTTVMAANQGLYNGFLAAGLIWALLVSSKKWSFSLSVYFLSCVIIAGIYGSLTITGKVFFTQAIPAIIALIFVLVNNRMSKIS